MSSDLCSELATNSIDLVNKGNSDMEIVGLQRNSNLFLSEVILNIIITTAIHDNELEHKWNAEA